MNRRGNDITPDEVFAESSNLSSLNTSQFEGRLEKPITQKTFMGIGIFLFLIFAVMAGRLWYLQVQNGKVYAQISENNRLHHVPVFAERGVIFDRNGQRLAWNIHNEESPEFSLREYSEKGGLAHLIGYVTHPAKDSSGFYYQNYFEGKSGVEKSFDDALTGENGIKITETNVSGDILSESVIESPVSGENIYLSIDARLQEKLYSTMEKLSEETGFEGGAAVMMDVQTGEVIALTSYPEYDNQAFALGEDSKLINEALNSDRLSVFNRAVSGAYTPGSIVKPYLAIGALNEGVIDPEKEILSTGELVVPNRYNPDQPTIFTDFKPHGWVDLSDALAVSSNVYFYQVGGGFEDQEGIGVEKIGEYMRAFGLGQKTGIDLGPEEDGVIPSPEWKEQNFEDGTWRIGDTYNTAIGQYGFQVTPLQMARAITAIANDGIVFRPTLFKTQGSTAEIEGVVDVSGNYFEEVRKGMRQAVEDGTGKGLLVPYIDIAAKTGTAERGVSNSRINAWVTGFFPYENPRYSFAVLMENGPRETNFGGIFIMRTLFDWMRDNAPEYLDL